MSELIIPPSPNWFLSDCLSVGADGYLIYGTLSTDIAILKPSDSSNLYFSDIKIIQRAHKDRVSCIALCPNWLNTRLFVSGSDDGYVKLWNAQTYSYDVAHNTHLLKKETVISVVFVDENRVLSVGSQSLLALWNIKSNNVESDSKVIRFFKPLCMALCPHKPGIVALGTKQGVVVILSVSDKISILYKAPGHNAEITSLSWCPDLSNEYLDNISKVSKTPKDRKILKPRSKKTSSIQDRLNRNQNDDEDSNKSQIELSNGGSVNEENSNSKMADENDEDDFLKECKETLKLIKNTEETSFQEDDFLKECKETLKLIKNTEETSFQEDDSPLKSKNEKLLADAFDEYGRSRHLPKLIDDRIDKTFEKSVLETTLDSEANIEVADESDIFDIYADHEVEEFGHKKNIFIKESPENLNIAESLNKLDESQINNLTSNISTLNLENKTDDIEIIKSVNKKFSDSFYLASCCKKGLLCIWRWGGTLVFSKTLNNISKNKNTKTITHPFGALHWLKSTELIVASRESQVLSIRLAVDNTKKFKNLHNEHKRGLFRITSDSDQQKSIIWSASMDRLLIGHSITDNITNVYSTFGGYVYDIQVSPIDPTMFAIGVGDGTIRIWRSIHGKTDSIKIKFLKQFWNGISGKVLSIAWHPIKEKCLAFTTYEGRIGLLDVASENAAKVLPLALSLGAFRVCWDKSNNLFACGGDMLVVYDTSKPEKDATKVTFNIQGENWGITTMLWSEKYLCIGSSQGRFALMQPSHPFELITAAHPYKKRLQQIAIHPNAVTSDDNLSPYANLIAVSANTKNLVIFKVVETEGNIQLETYADFIIHTDNIINIAWSPHHNGQILSTSKDCSVQIWDVLNKCLLHTFVNHQQPALTAIWCPSSPKYIYSSGGDYTLRIWDLNKYPPQEELCVKEKQKKKSTLAKMNEFDDNLATLKLESEESISKIDKLSDSEQNIDLATISKPSDKKSQKKHYPLTNFWKEYKKSSVEGVRQLFNKLKSKIEGNEYSIADDDRLDYLNIYGNHSDIENILISEEAVHKETFNWNALVVMGVLSGKLKETLEYVSEKRKLTSSFLALAPSVSNRFWKEILAAYCTQLEGNDAKKYVDTSMENMGKLWQAILLLSANQIEEGCAELASAGLHAEALCAARIRRADHIAEKQLKVWCQLNVTHSRFCKAAECYLALGEIIEAANILGKSSEETDLALAAEMAKFGEKMNLAN